MEKEQFNTAYCLNRSVVTHDGLPFQLPIEMQTSVFAIILTAWEIEMDRPGDLSSYSLRTQHAANTVRQRVIHDRVLCDLRQRDVLAHIVQVRAVVLPHDKKLAAIAEHGGADAGSFGPRILLHDGNVPTVELAKLGVGFLNDFLPAGDVEKSANFFVDVPFPNRTGQRHDVLARVVGDEEASGGLQLLR